MSPGFSLLLFVLVLSSCLPVLADVDSSASAGSSKPLFGSHKVLDMVLSVDFDALCRPRETDDCQYTPTQMTYTTASGADHAIPVQIQIRGGWRAQRDNCAVPPLFVRFSPAVTDGTPFAGQRMLPLTTHCRNKKSYKFQGVPGREYEQYVLREYLGYRLYNVLTDLSLRVRLVRLSYKRPGKRGKSVTRYAFFTEHFDDLAARHDLARLPAGSFDAGRIDLPSSDRIALFNFMIGNTDWSVVRQRNILLLGSANGEQFPVPYDLDMSGLVNAEYAGVSPRLNLPDVLHRYYLGFCHPQVDFDGLFARFRERKRDMQGLVDNIPGMSSSGRKQSRRYLRKFFDVLASPQSRQDNIIDACQSWPPSTVDHTTPPDAV